MKIMKERSAPHLLTVLQYLNNRMALSTDHKQGIKKMEKGYQGEIYFDTMLKETINGECLVLNELLLSINNNLVQIDSLVITGNGIYLYEIKNFEGEYIHKTKHLRTPTGSEFTNPLDQLNRAAILLKQQLRRWSYSIPLNSAVVYVNPSFVLHESPADKTIVLPGQIHSYLSRLNGQMKYLKKDHYHLANKILAAHLKKSPYRVSLPEFSFDTLKKGLICLNCGSFELKLTQRTCSCYLCGYQSSLHESLISHIEGYCILFPKEMLTRNDIVKWCGNQVSPRVVWTVLRKHYGKVGNTRSAYYIK